MKKDIQPETLVICFAVCLCCVALKSILLEQENNELKTHIKELEVEVDGLRQFVIPDNPPQILEVSKQYEVAELNNNDLAVLLDPEPVIVELPRAMPEIYSPEIIEVFPGKTIRVEYPEKTRFFFNTKDLTICIAVD